MNSFFILVKMTLVAAHYELTRRLAEPVVDCLYVAFVREVRHNKMLADPATTLGRAAARLAKMPPPTMILPMPLDELMAAVARRSPRTPVRLIMGPGDRALVDALRPLTDRLRAAGVCFATLGLDRHYIAADMLVGADYETSE